MKRPVVVTGLGAVTPLGEDFPSSWSALIAGQSALAPLTLFDTSGCRCHQAATAPLPELDHLPAKLLRRLPRASRFAIQAAREALDSANLLGADQRSLLPELTLSVSTTAGGMRFGEDFFPRSPRPETRPPPQQGRPVPASTASAGSPADFRIPGFVRHHGQCLCQRRQFARPRR